MNIDNIYINYYQYGKKRGTDLVLLHGWGQNMQMMMPISNSFTNMFRITVVDLPGFGASAEQKKALTIEDYADILNKLFIKLKIKCVLTLRSLRSQFFRKRQSSCLLQ